jgi:hypothetical protein
MMMIIMLMLLMLLMCVVDIVEVEVDRSLTYSLIENVLFLLLLG